MGGTYPRFRDMLALSEDSADKRAWDKLTIITTNYDICAEFLCWLAETPVSLPFEYTLDGESMSRPLYSVGQTKITLCKLHGSLNWFLQDRRKTTVDGRILQKAETLDFGTPYPMRLWPKAIHPSYNLRDTPLLVPPTYFKQTLPEPLAGSWRVAFDAITHASRIVVIGYTFPDSDTNMRYFLGSAIARNTDIASIDILDPNAEEIKARLGEDRRTGTHMIELMRTFDGSWSSGGFRLLQRA